MPLVELPDRPVSKTEAITKAIRNNSLYADCAANHKALIDWAEKVLARYK
jgi:hypothetical protein